MFGSASRDSKEGGELWEMEDRLRGECSFQCSKGIVARLVPGPRVGFLGFTTSACIARSVDMVSLLRVAAARRVTKQDPHFWMRLMMKESTARSMKCSGSSAERYWHRPVCSIGSRVVSCCGFTVGVSAGWVFLER